MILLPSTYAHQIITLLSMYTIPLCYICKEEEGITVTIHVQK